MSGCIGSSSKRTPSRRRQPGRNSSAPSTSSRRSTITSAHTKRWGQQPPAAWYHPSRRAYPEHLPAVEYAARCLVRRTHPNGGIKWLGRRVFISQALAGELLGLEEIADGCWRVNFGPVELGWLDARRPQRLHPLDPAPTLSPISPV